MKKGFTCKACSCSAIAIIGEVENEDLTLRGGLVCVLSDEVKSSIFFV